jgi:hypothetical protein
MTGPPVLLPSGPFVGSLFHGDDEWESQPANAPGSFNVLVMLVKANGIPKN